MASDNYTLEELTLTAIKALQKLDQSWIDSQPATIRNSHSKPRTAFSLQNGLSASLVEHSVPKGATVQTIFLDKDHVSVWALQRTTELI